MTFNFTRAALLRAGALTLVGLATASSVAAQASRVGATFIVKPFVNNEVTRYPAVAYDAVNNAYLVVWGLQKHGARFVSADGVPLGAPVRLAATDGGALRVACGAEINACLVAWIQEPSSIIGRLLRYNGGNVQFLTEPFVINSNGRNKLTSSPPAVGYSSSGQEFLVAWTDDRDPVWPNVRAQRVSSAGAQLGGEIQLAVEPTGWEGFPSLTYNSARNEFVVSHYMEGVGTASGVGVKRVQPGTGAVIGSSILYGSLFDQYPEITYNTRQDQLFAITWHINGKTWFLHGQIGDTNGQPIGGVLTLAVNGGGDGLGVTYNPVTNSYFAVFLHHDDAEIWGVGVNAAGTPGTPFRVTVSGTKLATKPLVAASTANTRALMVASENFGQAMGQLLQDGESSGGGPPPPPPPPVTKPWMSIDAPGNNATVPTNNVFLGGWTVDQGAPSGTGVDVIHVWAFPTFGGSPTFLGQARHGVMRPDVGAFFGDSRFSQSGFDITASLPAPGVYDIVAYARSTVTGQFSIWKIVRVTGVTPTSIPVMWTDLPAQNGVVGTTFQVSGWAIDLGPSSGPGVDTIHVWAYPTSGAPPVFVGVAPYGTSRPDLAAAFGNARFTNSGFNLLGSLPVGDYTLVAFAHSSVANAFNNVSVKTIFVR